MKKLFSLLVLSAMTGLAQAAEPDTIGYDKFRFGGYGEVVANFKDYGINRFYGHQEGNAKQHHNTISVPRFVLAFDYKFTPKWILGAEIEFEYGGTGTSYELENTENGEYETEVEKGGEVALEQLHITRMIVPEFNIRAGHLIVPVGLTNEHHEPINFFGSSRPEGESTIIPCTWHETGIEFLGKFGKGYGTFDYEAMIVTGLNANGFDRNKWVRGGKQGLFEGDNFTSPAYVARLNYTGVSGLRIGGSIYYCANAGANSDKLITYDEIGKILGLDHTHNIIVIGMGNLGQAISRYMHFDNLGFKMVGFFDVNPDLKGKMIRDIPVSMMDELPEFVKTHQVDIAALTLPRANATQAAEMVIDLGIKSIWNFALVDLDVPEDVTVQNVHLSDSLMQLSYNIMQKK